MKCFRESTSSSNTSSQRNLSRLVTGTVMTTRSIILNRIPFEVEKHVQGKRYKRMKQHVKIKLTKNEDDGDDEAQYKADFDADAFESENKQVLYSIDGEQEDNEDDNESDASLEGVKLKKDEEIDDLADLYPKELDHSMNNEDGDHRREKCSRRKRLADSKMFTEQTTKKMKKTV
ncbi:uncharacterized protein PHALS_05158 [Plasmopara halstedii]|uniref:Uncharacterized protein n=1 Tax=Plasmopara halstedii TaxID=4781 RepID=A0A0P1B2J5_PLAHL|nr:uncharacterized protein PHALS_05158 [Plasmopara halstedii]CEG47824.1 hypothetical protein PHALS_05158 [Plasmopara halstedii]|eukprot:XP_024584193.1 hypothetical protein PHALS_05158 [Plasmopara halstedii]